MPKIEQKGVVTSIYIDIEPGQEVKYLFQSDNHYDSPLCNRKLMTRHLQQAKRDNARVMIFGDFFDMMQGRFDPRRSMSDLRPEYRRPDYYDFVILDAAKYLAEYADQIDLISDGNHETSVLKNANTNPGDRLVSHLRQLSGGQIQHGGYGGWVRWMFNMSGGKNTGPRTSIRLKYHHGSGGEAPVTRGAIQTNRQAVYLPDANIIVNGHSHNMYYIPITRERLSNKGQQYFDTQHHLRIPGYKQGYADSSGGWEIERGGVPKPIGAYFVTFTCTSENNKSRVEIKISPEIQSPDVIDPISHQGYTGKIYDDDAEGA